MLINLQHLFHNVRLDFGPQNINEYYTLHNIRRIIIVTVSGEPIYINKIYINTKYVTHVQI